MDENWKSQSGLVKAGVPFLVMFGVLFLFPKMFKAGEVGTSISPANFDHTHQAWTSILRQYVHDGQVEYTELKGLGRQDLVGYLHLLESVSLADYEKWSREQKLAFWINAYNAYTIKLILDNFPVKSIRSIGLLPLAGFRRTFIPMDRLRGRTLSLDDIEHQILRKELREPRVHFAIVCASKSCPVLRSEAYRAAELERQLDDAAQTFIRDSTRNRFNPSTRTLYLSSIFKWFGEDFDRAAGSVTAFVSRYAGQPVQSALREGRLRVEYLDYDWSLNGK